MWAVTLAEWLSLGGDLQFRQGSVQGKLWQPIPVIPQNAKETGGLEAT